MQKSGCGNSSTFIACKTVDLNINHQYKNTLIIISIIIEKFYLQPLGTFLIFNLLNIFNVLQFGLFKYLKIFLI